jgi:hypothetical protein
MGQEFLDLFNRKHYVGVDKQNVREFLVLQKIVRQIIAATANWAFSGVKIKANLPIA